MTQLTFRSAGVSATEVDLTGATSIEPVGIPAAVLSTTERGPAFVPMIQPTIQDYEVRFGKPVEGAKEGPLASTEWLRTQQSLLQVRVLGVGDGSERTTAGLNAGKVTSAGFVVGAQQPQTSLSGGLGHNPYAYTTSSAPSATGSVGRTWMLGCFMSESAGSTMFTEAGLAGLGVPVVRGMILAASGVLPQLSASNASSLVPSSAANYSAGNIQGFYTGSLNLSASRQEFVMLLNGHRGSNQLYPNVITASFDPDAPNYMGTLLNRDPLKLEEAGYVLYSHWDIHPSFAVPTGSGIVAVASGSTGVERIAFIVTGSQTVNSGSTTAPNFENFEDRFRTPGTPWFTTQKFGGKVENLFKVWSLSDGSYANSKVKISIENIAPSNTDTTKYGTFDIIVRDFNDTDGNKVILEQWRGLSLNPKSQRYIAKVIGDTKLYFNFDAADNSQKLEAEGFYPNRSKYIRVELSDKLVAEELDETALPVGFRGPQHLVTSGSAPLMSLSDTTYFTKTNVIRDTVQPPVPMRLSLNRGTGTSQTADRTLYWGVQFEKFTLVGEPNASKVLSPTVASFTKYYPNFQTTWQNVVVSNNAGVADTAENAILDADRFNNNAFSLEKIKIRYNTTTNAADLNNLTGWSYVRAGNIATNSSAATRALTVADLLDPSVRTLAKFTVFMEGGFDGVREFNRETKYLSNNAINEELNNSSRGFANGATVKAYQKGIELLSNTLEVDMQLFVMPGIRADYLTDTAIQMVEQDRFDCFYIMDIEVRDTSNNIVTSPTTQEPSIRNTANAFRSRGLNSSFAATYFPDQIINDLLNRTVVRAAPSVAALGAFGKNDSVGFPWFAPAGLTRGALDSVVQSSVNLSRANLDDLYSVNINPIAVFPGQGPVVWGQKTVLARQSAFERINVRRLLLTIRREVKKLGLRLLFEPAQVDTLTRFSEAVNPVLKRIQDLGGVDSFAVRIDTTTTTALDLENKTIRGKIYLTPSKTLEYLALDFVVTNRGSFASDQ
jgi:hypothetical protein